MQSPASRIAYDVFASVDMRVGRILDVQPFPKARNPSWKLRIDLGPLGEKWSSAQVTNYTPEQLVGTLVVCVVNFAPRNIAGFQSEVLVLGAPDEMGNVILLTPRHDGSRGTAVSSVATGARIF